MNYLQLQPGNELTEITHLKPFKCVVVVEEEVLPDEREAVSKWLVQSGCVFMMAWGKECRLWEDSVDWATIEQCQYNEIPAESLVLTTCHEDETLKDVFEFAKHAAFHGEYESLKTLVLHISQTQKEMTFKTEFENC